MGVSIPIRLTLAESGAVALAEIAHDLDAALDAMAFLVALDNNHRLWLTLSDVAHRCGWRAPDRRLASFVTATSCQAGRGVDDEAVEALIGINLDVATELAAGQDMDTIRRRALLAWREAAPSHGLDMERWLIGEMARKSRMVVSDVSHAGRYRPEARPRIIPAPTSAPPRLL